MGGEGEVGVNGVFTVRPSRFTYQYKFFMDSIILLFIRSPTDDTCPPSREGSVGVSLCRKKGAEQK